MDEKHSGRWQAAVADSYVRGGAYGSQNFGTASVLMVKNDVPDFAREAYLRFDLSGVTGTIQHAILRLTPTSVGQPGIEHAIALVPDDAWGETTITWYNRPTSSEVAFARWIVEAGQLVELDITSLVQEAQASDGKLSLRIFSTRRVGATGSVSYGSRQGNAANRPQLVLITTN